MIPVVHGLEAKYGNCIDFVYLDIDNPTTRDAKTRLGYRAQPEMYLLDGKGNVLWKKFGYIAAGDLEAVLKNAATQP